METKNILETLLLAVDNVVGKKVRVISDDKMDKHYGIEKHLRWHIGEEFVVGKIEIKPWGCFLYKDHKQNINVKRVEIIN